MQYQYYMNAMCMYNGQEHSLKCQNINKTYLPFCDKVKSSKLVYVRYMPIPSF